MAHEFNAVGEQSRAGAATGTNQRLADWIESPCEYDAGDRVWRLQAGRALPYPNDAFAASKLEHILQNAHDLSSLSPELERLGGQWPASYYLSAKRTSLLRGFAWEPDSEVLEVGAGCGTISRYLGETFRSVLAVEGEPHRARMARMRTRDLDNLHVLNAPYEDIAFKGKFDVVFSIGVLEYAAAFFGQERAAEKMLAAIRASLRPDGVLVLAIENQLGLKYFAGSAEDHTGLPFDGIEGYARSSGRGIETYSRKRLAHMLRLAGFETLDFFYPFPDYKFPRCVIDEQTALHDSAGVAGLIANEPASDYLMPPSPQLFNQKLACREALGAGMLPDLANSFLVMATPSGQRSARWSAPWNGVAISVGRRLPAYWSETVIQGVGTEQASVERRQLLGAAQADPWVSVELPYREPWHDTPTLGFLLERALQDPACDTQRLLALLEPWKAFLDEAFAGAAKADGALFDAVPQNMVTVAAQLQLFDRELRTRARVSKNTILIRGLRLTLVQAAQTPGAIPGLRRRRYWSVIRELAAALGVRLTIADLWRAARFEYRLQRAITGRQERMILLWPIDLPLRRIRSTQRRRQAHTAARNVYRVARRLRSG